MSDQSSDEVSDRIVLRAMSHDPGLPEEVARHFAGLVLGFVAEDVSPDDAPELARRLLATNHEAGASAASVVAAAASEVLTNG